MIPLAAMADEACATPARVGDVASARAERVKNYRAVFQQCRDPAGATRLATRAMEVDGEALLLAVDPQTLSTRLERAACWVCADTTEETQRETRFLRSVGVAANATMIVKSSDAGHSTWLQNAGLKHGAGDGTFITGDLCPSRQPLDRAFLEGVAANGRGTPIALSISGLWLTHHSADFEWLREQERSGALAITWVDHSWDHPYDPTKPLDQTFLLTQNVDMEKEIMDTERLLIARGETPSVFFRFPGLISNPALMEIVRAHHLVALGADGWLVFNPPLRDGSIILVHPNGNEPAGLRQFTKLSADGKLRRPFRPINEAP